MRPLVSVSPSFCIAGQCQLQRRRPLASHVFHGSIVLRSSTTTIKSPYSILGIRPDATLEQIKAAFRKLAKQHHPDLNPSLSIRNNNNSNNDEHKFHPQGVKMNHSSKMTEIVSAYQQVLNPSWSQNNTDSQIGIACEVSTLEELQRSYHVYAIQILFHEENNSDKHASSSVFPTQLDDDTTGDFAKVSNSMVWRILVHPDDSVMDFKQALQEKYGEEWGIMNHHSRRHHDRYGLARGWEIVASRKNDALEVLGNHWFLHSYNVTHGSMVHAIIRKHNGE